MIEATPLFAALLALLYLYLTLRVIRQRHVFKIAYGESVHEPLQNAVRAHANFQQYAPLFLILLYLEESLFHSVATCYVTGALFLLGRMSHAYSMLVFEPRKLAENVPLKTVFRYRFFGMVPTFFTIAFLAALLLVQYLLVKMT
jgi:uncharacterized membrane protein YecN with MAPEG domain